MNYVIMTHQHQKVGSIESPAFLGGNKPLRHCLTLNWNCGARCCKRLPIPRL